MPATSGSRPYSGSWRSLDTVKALVAAGADLGAKDRIHQGTALGWAEYLDRPEIAAYLRAPLLEISVHVDQ